MVVRRVVKRVKGDSTDSGKTAEKPAEPAKTEEEKPAEPAKAEEEKPAEPAKSEEQLAEAAKTKEVLLDMKEIEEHMAAYISEEEPAEPEHNHSRNQWAHAWTEGYDGAHSQWREHAEDSWQHWDWPPKGWRPSEWHDAYWNQKSQYYAYNSWDWNERASKGAYATPSPKATPSTTPPYSRQSSLDVEEALVQLKGLSLEAQFSRANTGDLVVQTTEDGADQGKPQDAKPEGAGKSGDPKKSEEPKKPEGPSEDPKKTEELKDDQKGKTEAGEDGAKTEDPNPEGVDVSDADPEVAKKKKAALARYMRYYRSIRSRDPGARFSVRVLG